MGTACILDAACEAQVEKDGGRVMEMRVYVDRSPLLWTDWRIEVVGIPPTPTAGVAMSLGIVWWAAILIAALAIIAVITRAFIIKPLTYKHKPLPPEIEAT